MSRKKRKHLINIDNQDNEQDLSSFIVDLKKLSKDKIFKEELLDKKKSKTNQVKVERKIRKKIRFKLPKFKLKKIKPNYFKEKFVWPFVLTFLKLIMLIIKILRGPYRFYKNYLEAIFKKNKRDFFCFRLYKTIKSKIEDYFQLYAKIIKKKQKKHKKQAIKEIFRWPSNKELRNPHLFFRKNNNKEKEDEKKYLSSSPYQTGFKAVLGFVFILLILILPFKVLSYYNIFNLQILESKLNLHSQSAMKNLMSASDKAKSLEMSEASNHFSLAGKEFLAAQSEIEKIDSFVFGLASLSKNPKYQMASQGPLFLEAGLQASIVGKELGLAMDGILNNASDDFLVGINNFLLHGKKAANSADNLNSNIEKINPDLLPTKYQAEFVNIKNTSKILSKGLSESVDLIEKLKPFLGIEADKRYLLIFQNNSELRASGGFMGSYALIDFSRGKIKNLEVPKGGTYDTEAGLDINVESPEPLWLVNPRWYFWDSNWWPDWKKTAKNIAWFYEKSDGPTVDGVISFTPDVIEDLLKVVGSIDMTDEYGVVITHENFWEKVQPIVEEKTVNKVNEEGKEIKQENKEPKKIIGDILTKILNELPENLDPETLISILSLTEKNLEQKHILLYFTDDNLQSLVEKKSWAGRIKDSQYDYLSVINTNIAGQKTDRAIEQDIVHYSKVTNDGSIINTVKILRNHKGVKRQEFTGVRNVNWMRIYVPQGSELISVSGFKSPDNKYFSYPKDNAIELDLLKEERNAYIDQSSSTRIYNDLGKTVFANWTMVDPGESNEIIIKYKLPFKFNNIEMDYDWLDKLKFKFLSEKPEIIAHSLLVQKQPGSNNTNITSYLKLNSDNYRSLWSSSNISELKNSSWSLSSNLDNDRYFGVLWEKINSDK